MLTRAINPVLKRSLCSVITPSPRRGCSVFPRISKAQVRKTTDSQLPRRLARPSQETTQLLSRPPVASLTSLLSTETTSMNQTTWILLSSSTQPKKFYLTELQLKECVTLLDPNIQTTQLTCSLKLHAWKWFNTVEPGTLTKHRTFGT